MAGRRSVGARRSGLVGANLRVAHWRPRCGCELAVGLFFLASALCYGPSIFLCLSKVVLYCSLLEAASLNSLFRIEMTSSHPAFSCPGHGQPCETRSVTKAGSPHLGRPFYVCTASPQCKGWFQFADEPVRPPGKPLTSDPAYQPVPSWLAWLPAL